jgi:hypothetical protein
MVEKALHLPRQERDEMRGERSRKIPLEVAEQSISHGPRSTVLDAMRSRPTFSSAPSSQIADRLPSSRASRACLCQSRAGIDRASQRSSNPARARAQAGELSRWFVHSSRVSSLLPPFYSVYVTSSYPIPIYIYILLCTLETTNLTCQERGSTTATE